RGLNDRDLRGQRVRNLKLAATDRLTDHSSVDENVRVLRKGRGNEKDEPADLHGATVVALLLDLRDGRKEGIERQRGVSRDIRLGAGHVTKGGGGTSLQDVAAGGVEVSGVDTI